MALPILELALGFSTTLCTLITGPNCVHTPCFMSGLLWLTHWGRVTNICVSKLTIIGSDNALSPGRRQAIIWTNAGILLVRTLGTNFSDILGKIHSFSFKKMHYKMSSAKGRLFSLGLNELRNMHPTLSWWRHDVGMLYAWLALCKGNPPVPGG